jgi:hypothetical protein
MRERRVGDNPRQLQGTFERRRTHSLKEDIGQSSAGFVDRCTVELIRGATRVGLKALANVPGGRFQEWAWSPFHLEHIQAALHQLRDVALVRFAQHLHAWGWRGHA